MRKLPHTPAERALTAIRRMTKSSAGGRTNLAAPTVTPPSARTVAAGGIGFVGPSLWSGETDAIRANAAEVDIVREPNWAAIAALPTQDPDIPASAQMEAQDNTSSRIADVGVVAANDGGSEFATAQMTAEWVEGTDPNTLLASVSAETHLHPYGVELRSTNDGQGLVLGRSTTPTVTGNFAFLFVRDNGAGKDQLCVLFKTGAVQVLATEP